jgi:hypothetical protein
MPLHEFGKSDILYNQIKAHPSSSFFIYDSNVYYNYKAAEVGKFATNVPNVTTGHVNLLELNVDRSSISSKTKEASKGRIIGVSSSVSGANVFDTGFIYPFVVKGTDQSAFRNITRSSFIHDYEKGDVITGSYRMSASVSRQLFQAVHKFNDYNFTGSALKNSLDYAKRLGEHYDYPSGSSKETNIIYIPSIFYGSEIKKGTVDLKFYVTGTMVAQLKDSRRNGALIQHRGIQGSSNDGEIAGCVLYKEGFVILTGSWDLSKQFPATNVLNDLDIDGTAVDTVAKWTRFGMGALDKVTSGPSLTNGSASFSIDFAGTHKIPTVTMLAHANRGELNYSNNPTYVSSSQKVKYTPLTGTHLYREQELVIKNIHSSSYAEPTGSLVKTTYITKVGIYDKKKKLIGIASLAKPVKKTEDRDLTFKLKLDI